MKIYKYIFLFVTYFSLLITQSAFAEDDFDFLQNETCVENVTTLSTQSEIPKLSDHALAFSSLSVLFWGFFGDISTLHHHKDFGSFSISIAKGFSSLKNLPQYRFIARPVYEFFGGNKLPYISIPVSFFVTDLIMHQLLSQIFSQYKYGMDFSKYSFHIFYPLSLAWISLSFPVVYAHMLRARSH